MIEMKTDFFPPLLVFSQILSFVFILDRLACQKWLGNQLYDFRLLIYNQKSLKLWTVLDLAMAYLNEDCLVQAQSFSFSNRQGPSYPNCRNCCCHLTCCLSWGYGWRASALGGGTLTSTVIWFSLWQRWPGVSSTVYILKFSSPRLSCMGHLLPPSATLPFHIGQFKFLTIQQSSKLRHQQF